MKKAFTLIELIFVLVIVGIVAATVISRTKTNPLQEATIQVLSDIRYTQHLALIDDKFNMNDSSWYKKRWLIVFSNSVGSSNDTAYTIFTDIDGDSTGDPSSSSSSHEIAVNPENPRKKLTGGYGSTISESNPIVTKKLNLTKSYGVTGVTFSGDGCPSNYGTRLNFDYQGRPIKGRLGSSSGTHGNVEAYEDDNLMRGDCNITITKGADSAVIRISEETGYAKIVKFK
jgi:prepilin-type N-terminal cleavage/methylation domain-containing protein